MIRSDNDVRFDWSTIVRIVFLFVNNENHNFIKEIKHVVRASTIC